MPAEEADTVTFLQGGIASLVRCLCVAMRTIGVSPVEALIIPRVLAAVLDDGLDAVEAAIREALDAGAASDEVILNILARYREPATDRPLDVVVDLKLSHPPIADCARYDTVRGLDAAA